MPKQRKGFKTPKVGVDDLATTNPTLAGQMDDPDTQPTEIYANANYLFWWKCHLGHRWRATANNRTKGTGCPYCSGRKVWEGYNDLATTNPELAAQMDDPTLLPSMVSSDTNTKVWWKCGKGHRFMATPNNRKDPNSCRICSNQEVLVGYNDLATTNPDIASQMDDADCTATDVTRSAKRSVWWRCDLGHRWRSPVYSRTAGNGCSVCSNRVILVGYNDLQTLDPDLAKEMDDEVYDPTMVSVSSGRVVGWRCENGHKWRTRVADRTSGRGCLRCSTNISKIEKRLRELINTSGIPGIKHEDGVNIPISWRKRAYVAVDVLVESSPKKLIVEYDGYPWHHGNEERDVEKTELLIENGYLVVRVRDFRLRPLGVQNGNLMVLESRFSYQNSALIGSVSEIEEWVTEKNA